ncbi:hypothetical protein COP2_021287 [Malus domestica]
MKERKVKKQKQLWKNQTNKALLEFLMGRTEEEDHSVSVEAGDMGRERDGGLSEGIAPALLNCFLGRPSTIG